MQIADEGQMLLQMALQRPCKAAFSLTPRWKKRVDGKNVYDGRPYVETAKKLHLHDYPVFRRDFNSLLTRREKLTLAHREAAYRIRIVLHQLVRTNLASRLRVPSAVNSLRSLKYTSAHRLGVPLLRDDC